MQHAETADAAVVVRLVYDGPPRSGKTTSLRALAGSLARPHLAMDEAEGRTLYFDWVEYVGGTFEGQPIRCQIVSVPGQRVLARRREALLSSADAVIFVADTTGAGIAEAVESMGSLRAILDGRPGPRPGLIVQANKRDQPDALPLDALRSHLDGDRLAFVESVATRGDGIREAFVLAVRLALDRLRERLASGEAEDAARADTPEQLLARLQAADTEPHRDEPPAAAFLREVLAGEDALRTAPPLSAPRPREASGPRPVPDRPPRLPGSDAPSGRVWPPVTGRLLLHEIPAGTAAEPRQGADGSWRIHLGNWFFHSAREHCFLDLDAGRQELLRWARLHSVALDRLAPRRCIVLADTGPDGGPESWRLWQLVHHEPSLRQQLAAVLDGGDPAAAAEALLACAGGLLAARETMAREPALPCRLELLGRVASSLVYVGVLPPPSWTPPADGLEAGERALLRRELAPVLRQGLAAARIDVPSVLASLEEARASAGYTGPSWLPDLLADVLAGLEARA